MTGVGCPGYIEAGCGPDETVAAEYEPDPEACGGAGSDAGGGGNPVKGAGAAAGPIPGPIALVSWLYQKKS